MIDMQEYYNSLTVPKNEGKLKPIFRILAVVSGSLLIAAFFFPVWRLNLKAVNYPEGLNIWIHLTKMSGDLTTINTLNKFIGVMKIGWHTFPEIKYLPYIVGIMAASMILIGFLGSIRLFKIGIIFWGVVVLLGGVDALWRLYQVGHNLDPTAPINIAPFMPPLLGTGYLAAYQVDSLPGVGMVLLLAGMITAGLAYFFITHKKV